MTCVAVFFGLILGMLVAFAKRAKVPVLTRVCILYIEAVRNTPFLVQIFIFYFGLSSLGYTMSANLAAVITMVINVGAYSAEIVRSGMDAVPPGQVEAAECLGLSRLRIYWHVIMLPAFEKVYPAITSQFVLMMLMSSITSQISAEELTGVANNVQSITFLSLETYIVVALLYLILAVLLKGLFSAAGLVLFRRRRVVARSARVQQLRHKVA
jgi:polar amino acid transport system permease protein